jgi:hypothetical protein
VKGWIVVHAGVDPLAVEHLAQAVAVGRAHPVLVVGDEGRAAAFVVETIGWRDQAVIERRTRLRSAFFSLNARAERMTIAWIRRVGYSSRSRGSC